MHVFGKKNWFQDLGFDICFFGRVKLRNREKCMSLVFGDYFYDKIWLVVKYDLEG